MQEVYYNNKKKEFSGGGNSYPERGKINLIGDIEEIYQYIGKDKPTEFIAEESTERDYYTKLETNNLLDKKQNKLTAGENIKIDEKTNTISATGGSSVDENRIFNNKDDKVSTTRLVNEIIKTNVGGKTLIYRNNPVITDDLDIPNKKYIDDKIPNLDNYYIKEEIDIKIDKKQDKLKKGSFINVDKDNTISVGDETLMCKGLTYNNYKCSKNLKTIDKSIIGGINENKSNILERWWILC
ncbi:hypothetical protein [Spiroplasma endosymbiont of Colias croceus]|uniref:hypothetical protein n=1 Tax=Spiroplasma endosymbiont of Colias croceus TaxID=3066310 RepID=UPI0030CDCE63